MKAIKYIGLVVVGFVAVVLLLFCGLVLFFDPNSYKADIERIAKEKANIELHIEGDIRWTFYPWLGISLQETSVASVETPTKPFAKVKELDLSVRLMPLFQGQVKMNDININGLTVDLFKDEEGNSNWSKVGEVAKTADQIKTNTPETPTQSDNVSKKINLDINSITINNTKFNYKDLKTRQEFAITDIHLSTGAIHDGEPVLINLGANFNNKKPSLTTSIQLLGKFTYDLNKQLYKIADMNLNSAMTGEPLSGKTIKLMAAGNLSADLKANTARWDSLEFGADVFKITGTVKATNILKAPNIQGQLVAADFDLQKFLTDLGIKAPIMASDKALTNVGFSADLNATTKNLALNNLKVKLDSTNIEGQVTVTDFAKPTIKAQLKGDAINIDSYLPPEAKQTAQTNKAPTANGNGTATTSNKAIWSSEVLFDIRNLKNINLDVEVAMNQLTAKKLPWQQFGLKVIAKNGNIDLQKFGGNLFTGSVSVLGNINVNTQLPQITLRPTISNLPIEKLLSVFEQDIPLKGTANLTGNLKTSGISQLNLVKNLNGNVNFVVNNGTFGKKNFEYMVCQAVAKTRGKSLTTQYNQQETPFHQLKGSATITNGTANNQDLIIAIAGLETKGKGTLNIVTMMLDYNIDLALKGQGSDPACVVGKDVSSREFPLVCKGSILAGAELCSVDVNNLILTTGKAEINKAIEKELTKGKLGKKLEDKPALKGLIKGLIK